MSKENLYITIFFLSIIFSGFVSFAGTKPLINIQVKNKDILAKQKFEISIGVKAEKGENPYCFFPIEFEEPDKNLSLDIKKIGTKESEKEVNLEVLIEGTVQEPGEYTIGPMRIPYILLSTDMEADFVKDNTRVIPALYWEVPSLHIKVKDANYLRFKRYIYIGVGTILIIIMVLFSVLYYLNRSKKRIAKIEVSLSEVLHDARKYRLDGNYYEYLKTLYSIVQKLQGGEEKTELSNLGKKLKDMMNEVGYRGINPTEQEMDLFWKEVANYVSILENEKRKNSS